ncbi:histidine-type phosphatase [Lonsdalea quercina]|uniref:histidine-type phosphatase n=1 Tax=Lonsdalea quercina TaxID=71657 RepID=UPI003976A80D
MTMFKLGAATLALVTAFPLMAAPEAPFTLENVVTLSRHGVRPQTDTDALNKATGKTWPAWTVQDGHLSGHGYAGIIHQGAYQIAHWRAAGLPIGAGCPTPEQVFAWSSPLQRTRATAQALLDGMFPGCGLAAGSTREKRDPLFQSVDMGLSQPDKETVKQQVTVRTGSAEELNKRYQPAITLLRAAVCADTPSSCEFLNAPWKLVEKEHGVSLKGPLSPGSTIGETIRLQYSEGLPLSQVAFGHARNAREVSALMALHAAKYDLVSDTPELARHGGTLLMSQLVAALTAGTTASAPENCGLQAPLVMFVGHDTNIAQIQTMLQMNWTLGEYPRNDIPPGGSLAFERYRNTRSGERYVRLTFSAMSLDQWRNLSPLTSEAPPLIEEYHDSHCQQTAVGWLCPLDDIVQKMTRAEVPGVTSPQPLFH